MKYQEIRVNAKQVTLFAIDVLVPMNSVTNATKKYPWKVSELFTVA
jgi:hypothetical protein